MAEDLFSKRLQDVRDLVADLEDFESSLPGRFNRQQFSRLRRQTATQHVWAAATGVTQSTIGNWERGFTAPERISRLRLKGATRNIKQNIVDKAFSSKSGVRIDVSEAYSTLRHSILRAALTDFDFDSLAGQIVPIPFSCDGDKIAVDEIAKDKQNLLQSLAGQAAILIESLSFGSNADVTKIVRYLSSYRLECEKSEPNARILNRYGGIITRSANSDDVSFGLNDVDSEALDGFSHDHIELMRLYFREALAKAQEIDAVDVKSVEMINDGGEFREVARLLEGAVDSAGEAVVDPSIPTLLRDIASEIRELQDQFYLSSDELRREVLSRRKSEAFKNGGVYVGRFVFFAALLSSMAVPAAAELFASLGTIIGLTEVVVPGSVRAQYEILREKFPALPALPLSQNRGDDEGADEAVDRS